MIDPHVHLRDWKQADKETVKHGLRVAEKAGLDGIFEMPNTDPPLITEKSLEARIRLAEDAGIQVFHGIYAGLTSDETQIREVIKAYRHLFPRVVGLKLFAGSSTGNLSVINEKLQLKVFQVLAQTKYKGVIAVHCEKEALFKPALWNPQAPDTHSLCRVPESEVESVRDIINFAHMSGFKGHLHICHVSVPESVYTVDRARQDAAFSISCGITPHHSLLNSEMVKIDTCLKINPPLRPKEIQIRMLSLIMEGKINWIESDHAPHTLKDKPAASGIPGLPFLPHFIRILQTRNINKQLLQAITHDNICAAFQIAIPASGRTPDYTLASEYAFNPYETFTLLAH